MLMLQAFGPLGSLALAIICGLAALLLAINLGHDAAHDALCRNRHWNRAVQASTFALLGVDARLWRMRHVGSHHVFPNVNGCDADIDDNPFLRLSPNAPRVWYHRYQHLYAPVLYWLVALHTILFQDFAYLSRRRLANMSDIRHSSRQAAAFLAGKFAYFVIFLVAPIAVLDLPLWQIIFGYLIMTFVVSEFFVLALIGTHFAEGTAFPMPDARGVIAGSWASHALATSVDWSPTSRLANFLFGGVNAHAAHHLFPTVSHVHYREIAEITGRVAAKRGVSYNRTTLPGLVVSHFRFLRTMGAA